MALPLPASVTLVSPAESCTSGRGKVGRLTPSTPTVPPVPSVPILVLPMLTVCVLASSRVFAPDTVVSAPARGITATPPVSAALGIMKMLDS